MALKDVKKMCSKFCTGKSSEIVGYTPPTLHKGMRWFVDFTAFDPARDIIALLRKEMEGIDEKLAIRYKMLDDANDTINETKARLAEMRQEHHDMLKTLGKDNV